MCRAGPAISPPRSLSNARNMSDDDFDPERESLSNVVFPRKLLKKFILLYKQLPCLWDRSCVSYKHKLRRHEAITSLTELVQQHDPSATRVHVLRKIESLRACVRREHKRVRDSRQKATDPSQLYKPHLWYYDLFSFVFNCKENGLASVAIAVKQNSENEADGNSEEEVIGVEDDDQVFEGSIEQYQQPDYSLATSMVEVSDSKYHGYDDDKQNNKRCTEVDDEYDAIGINVAAKLRNLPPNMRILAEKLINDVLFQAQVNGLNASTVISTSDPFKQDPL